MASADGQLKRAEAGVEKANLDLSYTRIVAPVDGMVGERALRVGAYVNPGARLLSVVPLNRAYVVGNFQETQLTHVQPGQPVSISVDTFNGETLRGHVESIAPATSIALRWKSRTSRPSSSSRRTAARPTRSASSRHSANARTTTPASW